MERLTKKLENGFYECVDEIMTWEDGIRQTQIIGQLEDIEEAIGIDLITKDKVEQSYNVYYKKNVSTLTLKYDEIELCRINSFRREGIDVHLLPFDGKIFFLPYNEYGKTWALTKEELQ